MALIRTVIVYLLLHITFLFTLYSLTAKAPQVHRLLYSTLEAAWTHELREAVNKLCAQTLAHNVLAR